MRIADLQKDGGFVSEAGESRTIKWHGDEGEVQILRVSFGKIAQTQTLPEAERNVELVRLCVRFDDGKEQLSREQAESLDPALAIELLKAIADVNRLDEASNGPN